MEPVSPVSLARPEGAALDREFAKDQPQYRVLTAIRERGPEGKVTSRWRLTWAERFTIFLSGNLWITQMSWRRPLQPILPSTEEPVFGEILLPAPALEQSKTYEIGPGSTFAENTGFKLAPDETATCSTEAFVKA